jgi:hypothetical protein
MLVQQKVDLFRVTVARLVVAPHKNSKQQDFRLFLSGLNGLAHRDDPGSDLLWGVETDVVRTDQENDGFRLDAVEFAVLDTP